MTTKTRTIKVDYLARVEAPTLIVAGLNDRRRSRRAGSFEQWADDEISPIES